MPFGAATVCTNIGKAMLADRLRQTPGTYTNSPKWAAMGVGATSAARTAAVTDTALSSEVESRVSGTESLVTTSVTNDTYQNVATIVATGVRAVDEFGLFDANTVGNMGFSATLAVVNLSSGDSIQFTSKVQVS
jgi:hypothetical protein